MRILHLQRRAIWGHSDEDIRDLVSYMNPDVTLTSELDGETTVQIESIVRPGSVIHLDRIKDTDSFTVGDHALLVIRNLEVVPQLDGATPEARQTTVVTDLIRKDIDEETFAFKLVNASLIDMLDSYLPDRYHLFSTAIDAGEIQRWNGTAIHGLGTTWSQSGHTIGLVSVGERPSYEFLPAERVGLLAIPGMGRRFSMQLKNHGIQDRSCLCRQHPRDMMQHPGIGPYRSIKWVSAAKALEEDTIYRIKQDDLAGRHRLFVDIETDSLQPSIIWHIGIYDDGTNGDSEGDPYTSLLEKNPDNKARIIHRFLDYLEQAMQPDSCLLAWYGSGFDFIHLDRFIQQYAPERKDIWTAIEKIDFMYWVNQHAALPCRTSKLDDVSQRLGYERGVQWLTGKEVGAIYASYMASKNDDDGDDAEPSWRQLRRYARDDVVSMKYIYDQIQQAPLLYDNDEMEKIYRRQIER